MRTELKVGVSLSFVHLHVYSSYSLLSSTVRIENLVSEAKASGFSAIALTDRNVMYASVAFYKECMKKNIKPIIGLTVDVIHEMGDRLSYPIVLLAKNNNGLKNLLKISSVVQTKSPEGIPLKWLKGYSKGLIAISPGRKGELEERILEGRLEEAKNVAIRYKDLFGKGNFYLGIQRTFEKKESIINDALVHLSKKLSIPLVALNEVYYLHKEDAFAHECLLAIKNGNKLSDDNREKLETTEHYLKNVHEMTSLFSDLEEAVKNTVRIAEECHVTIELHKQHLPKYPTPEGVTSNDLLEKLCVEGFHKRYPHPTEKHKKRLAYELNIIKRMNFSDYFLIVWDFMKYARESGILTGPGRGSAAGSIVAYVLYITDVDPMEHGLLFERFLNPERITMPDIDIDFPDHRRDEMIQYVCKKYGQLHVAQIITFGTLAARAVLRDVGKVFGLNTKELDQLSKLVPSVLGITLTEAYKQSEGLRKFIHQSPVHKQIFETSLKLEGLPRHTSIHAAGVVISEEPLIELIPIQEGHDGVFLTQYSMEYLEELGLLKMDFLGLRNLSLIENIVESIYRQTGKRINVNQIPLNDEKTFKLLSKGETTGVFQLESDGMREVLKRLKPSHFEDIVAVNALYRPGPMENIPLFINRKHGLEKIEYPHPDLEPILKNTYGIIVYQEQIMQVAAKMANFSLGEADLLRRAVGKKKKEILDKERDHFVTGAIQNGYDEKTAHSIYDLIVKFANYGFNRSHAVAYSFIAYQLAYLKAHYPLYFMASLLSSAIGNEKKIAQYIREAKGMKINILPPSINASTSRFKVEKGAIRYSLAAIKGIGIAALKEIFQARKKGPFHDLFDFCLRVSLKAVNRKTIEALVHSGSFDEFGKDRAVLLASIDVALNHAQLVKPEGVDQGDLFSEEEFMLKPKYVEVDPIRLEDKLNYEKEVLGFYLTDHPVSLYQPYFKPLHVTEIAEVKRSMQAIDVLAYITEVKIIRTKKGEEMAFLQISDQSGEMEVVVFPKIFRQIRSLLKNGVILLLGGKIEIKANNELQFILKNGKAIEHALEVLFRRKGNVYLRIEKEKDQEVYLKSLKSILESYKGNWEVVLYYESTNQFVKLGENFLVVPSINFLKEVMHLLGEKNIVLTD